MRKLLYKIKINKIILFVEKIIFLNLSALYMYHLLHIIQGRLILFNLLKYFEKYDTKKSFKQKLFNLMKEKDRNISLMLIVSIKVKVIVHSYSTSLVQTSLYFITMY